MGTLAPPPSAEHPKSVVPPTPSPTMALDRLPTYIVADTDLEMGASLGNSDCWVTTKGTGDIESVFSTYLGSKVIGALCVRFSGTGQRMEQPAQEGGVRRRHLTPKHNGAAKGSGHNALYSMEPGRFVIHPAYQRHEFDLPGGVHVEETVFVPRVSIPGDPLPASAEARNRCPIVYQVMRLRNDGTAPARLSSYGYVRLQGATPADVRCAYDVALGEGALVARNDSHPDWVRVFGIAGGRRVSRWESGFDDRQVYETTNVSPLLKDTTAIGAIVGALQLDIELKPREETEFAFITVFSHEGEAKARAAFNVARSFTDALAKTIKLYTDVAETAQLLSPDQQINMGMTWAKINMVRVMAEYPTGPAFTNDPSLSSAVVGRDAAWFVFGCDYLAPRFSRCLLDALAERQRESGLILEYYNAVTDERADNGFNINDNTPLFVLAARHHYRTTGDTAFLRHIYPAVRKAANCILRQRDTELTEIPPERKYGLVTCTVRGVELYGIAGWRNMIPNYTLNGAVTEVNAECAAALRATAQLAARLGTPEGDEDARTFGEAGEALVTAINTHLINPATGLYYLNIDLDGNIHTDVTADEIYPVMFDVAPDEVAYRVTSRLNYPDFWTPAGIRTVSQLSPDYDPYRQWGLMGGVWPGVSWWYAYAARHYHPEFMVEALRSSFAHYAREPKHNNTVPGQFSEWMDGESLVNRGMRLSPWEPPRFVLATVLGVCGVQLAEHDEVWLAPLVPKDWQWVGIRRLPQFEREVSLFGGRQADGVVVCSTTDFVVAPHMPAHAQHVTKQLYAEDVSTAVESVHPLAHHLAFRREGEVLVCVGSSAMQTMLFPLRLGRLLDDDTVYQADVYSSEWQRWTTGRRARGRDLAEAAVQIDAGGYRLFRFTAQ